MDNLKIFELYNNTDENTLDAFDKKTSSFLSVKVDKDETSYNTEWLDIMENTIKYIDNILRNPNRFIVNEEDVIKIELARRITVDSIKHLSRNTNLIQDYDTKTGDVKPSKILNINKEESYDTYENRLIYTLIQNMKSYIARKKTRLDVVSANKNNKELQYNATCEIGKEKINLSMALDAKLNDKTDNKAEILARIEKLEGNISALTYNDTYKTIDKKHIALVTPPIKKTNLIMKNVNFQYAMKLWTYLQDHMDDEISNEKYVKTFENDDVTKKYIDETFLMSYLALRAVDSDETKEVKEKINEQLVGKIVERMVDLDENITESDIQDMVSNQFTKIKYKNVVSSKDIQNKFKNSIDKYLDKIRKVKM